MKAAAAKPKATATYSKKKKRKGSNSSTDSVNKGNKETAEALGFCFSASLLLLLLVCILFGTLWDVKAVGPAWGADPQRFMQYFGLNAGLGIGCGVSYGIMFMIRSAKKRTRMASVGTFAISAVLVVFGASMMIATNGGGDFKGTITMTGVGSANVVGIDYDKLAEINPENAAGDLSYYYGDLGLVPRWPWHFMNEPENKLLMSNMEIHDDWVAVFYGTDGEENSVYCTQQSVQDEFNAKWGNGCPSVDVVSFVQSTTYADCSIAAALCSWNVMRGLFVYQWTAGSVWIILGMFGVATTIFGFAFVNYSEMANDPAFSGGKKPRAGVQAEDSVTEPIMQINVTDQGEVSTSREATEEHV